MSAIRDTSGLSTIGGISVRDGAGLSVIATGSIRESTGLTTFFSATGDGGADTLTPNEVDGYGYSKGNIAVTTDVATVNAPSGATVVWNFDPSTNWSAVSPGMLSSAFRRTNLGPGSFESTTVTATVTVGSTTYTTNSIIATAQNSYET